MMATAAAYTAVANGLRAAAASALAHTQELMITWQGPSAAAAQQAFFAHVNWMQQAALSMDNMAAHANAQANAYAAAKAAMPPLPLILKNRATFYLLLTATAVAGAATSGLATGAAGAALAAVEAEYAVMWVQAGAAMTAYAAMTVPNVMLLPQVTAAKPIVAGGGQAPSTLTQPVQLKPGTGGGSGAQPGSPAPAQPPAQGGTPANPGNEPGGGGGDTGGSEPIPGSGNSPSTDTAPMDALDSSDYGGADSPESTMPISPGFAGESSESSTLAALQAGTSAVGLGGIGLLGGGLNAMSGAATGFRMPSTWSAGSGTPFGATPAAAGSGPIGPAVAPRGATAPVAQLRRRREDEDERERAFTAGEPPEVPDLDRPAEIGVIEYADADDELVS